MKKSLCLLCATASAVGINGSANAIDFGSDFYGRATANVGYNFQGFAGDVKKDIDSAKDFGAIVNKYNQNIMFGVGFHIYYKASDLIHPFIGLEANYKLPIFGKELIQYDKVEFTGVNKSEVSDLIRTYKGMVSKMEAREELIEAIKEPAKKESLLDELGLRVEVDKSNILLIKPTDKNQVFLMDEGGNYFTYDKSALLEVSKITKPVADAKESPSEGSLFKVNGSSDVYIAGKGCTVDSNGGVTNGTKLFGADSWINGNGLKNNGIYISGGNFYKIANVKWYASEGAAKTDAELVTTVGGEAIVVIDGALVEVKGKDDGKGGVKYEFSNLSEKITEKIVQGLDAEAIVSKLKEKGFDNLTEEEKGLLDKLGKLMAKLKKPANETFSYREHATVNARLGAKFVVTKDFAVSPYALVGMKVATMGSNYMNKSKNKTAIGINAGAGLEFMFYERFTLGAEYNYGQVKFKDISQVNDKISKTVKTHGFAVKFGVQFL